MTVQLRCMDKDRKGESWTLDLDGDPVTVTAPDGQVMMSLPPDVVVKFFQLPSFSESIKYFSIQFGTQLRSFDVSKEDLKQIKALINRSLAAAGPEAIAAVKKKAIRDVLIGVGGIIAGIGLTVAGFVVAAQKPEGDKVTITFGLVIFGLVMVGKGIYGFQQYRQLTKMQS